MLDVTQATRELGSSLTDVWAISVKNECKELLFRLDFTADNYCVTFHAMNHDGKWHEFITQSEQSKPVVTASPLAGHYLYEPNASIMKLGCFNAVEDTFEINPVSVNSHLFLSERAINDFPGRVFLIKGILPFKEKEIKKLRNRFNKLNIATRNFKLSANELRQRMRVQDGGETYLFATTLANDEMVLFLTEKFVKS